MQQVRRQVADRHGVQLEVETRLVGFPSNARSEVER
jgi:UDP-N-acetylenolpyruvoylglucosamine reductase